MKKLLLFSTYIFLSAFILKAQNRPYITIWKTNVKGDTNSKQITIPAFGDFNYTWQEVGNSKNKGSGSGKGKTTIIFPNTGTYKVSMIPTGNNPFCRIDFGNDKDTSTLDRSLLFYVLIKKELGVNSLKLLNITQWGDIAWASFDSAYYDCENLKITAKDIPDLEKVHDMSYAFAITTMDSIPNLYKWDMSQVTQMNFMFAWSENFNQNINSWDVSNVKTMEDLFYRAYNFNQPLNNWNVSNVVYMWGMFRVDTAFNQPLNNWDVGNVRGMNSMFRYANSFNQPLNNWNVSNVRDMTNMFENASSFNQPLNNWDVSKVNRMGGMFQGDTNFNKPLDNWNVSNVREMSSMFQNASNFNRPLNNWNVSRVLYMDGMFQNATSFNQPLNNWEPSSVIYLWSMFKGAKRFNQSLGNWKIKRIALAQNMLDNSGLSCVNYSKTLKGWAKNHNLFRILGAKGLIYSSDVTKRRQSLIRSGCKIVGDREGDCQRSLKLTLSK